MPLSNEQIDEALARYGRELDRFQKLVDFVAGACRELMRENAIPATVQWRAKDPQSLRGKLEQKRGEFDSVDEVFETLKDFAAVRVATYVEDDRHRVVNELKRRFVGAGGGELEPDVRNLDEPSFYRATHCQVALPTDDLNGYNWNLAGATCEIQVVSLLAHVWNELEHDLIYKPRSGDLSPEEREALVNLGHQVRAGDGIIKALLDATDRRRKQQEGPFVDQWDFVSRVRDLFPAAAEFGQHSLQLLEELRAVGIDTPQLVDERLLGDDAEASRARGRNLLDRLGAAMEERGDEVVRLDVDTSDVLLMLFLEQHADSVLARHPGGRGRGRPSRIASAARRFKEVFGG